MSSDKSKKGFAWEKGDVLDEEQYAPLGEVHKKGRPKLVQAVHADPVLRKKERDVELKEKQSKPYRPHQKKEADDRLIVEDTGSGLTDNVETSAAKKLIDTGKNKKFIGLDRFGKRKKT